MNDLIDRAALIKSLWLSDKTADICQKIEHAPAVDAVEVRHGRWVDSEKYKGFKVCSSCRDCYVEKDWPDGKKWNYCPNCGAKMDADAPQHA